MPFTHASCAGYIFGIRKGQNKVTKMFGVFPFGTSVLKKIANRKKISERPVFLSLPRFDVFSQEGGKKRPKKLLWFSLDCSLRTLVPAGDSMDLHVQEFGICIKGGDCRSQFNLITDTNQHRWCWFPRGAGISSVSLHKLQCCETGTYFLTLQTTSAYSGFLSYS